MFRRSMLMLSMLLGACAEEAINKPLSPPSTVVPDLGSSPAATAAAAASQPVSQPASVEVVPAVPQRAQKVMTMESFMEDYIEDRAAKAVKAKARDPILDDLLQQVGTMMPTEGVFATADEKKQWKTIVDAALADSKYGQSCKQCHVAWKKPYKKAFRKREITVSLPLGIE